MFGFLPPIYVGAQSFCSKLEHILDKSRWDPNTTIVSDVFLQARPYFEDYSPFVNHFSTVQSMIHKAMQKRADFKAWATEQRKHPRVQDKCNFFFFFLLTSFVG